MALYKIHKHYTKLASIQRQLGTARYVASCKFFLQRPLEKFTSRTTTHLRSLFPNPKSMRDNDSTEEAPQTKKHGTEKPDMGVSQN